MASLASIIPQKSKPQNTMPIPGGGGGGSGGGGAPACPAVGPSGGAPPTPPNEPTPYAVDVMTDAQKYLCAKGLLTRCTLPFIITDQPKIKLRASPVDYIMATPMTILRLLESVFINSYQTVEAFVAGIDDTVRPLSLSIEGQYSEIGGVEPEEFSKPNGPCIVPFLGLDFSTDLEMGTLQAMGVNIFGTTPGQLPLDQVIAGVYTKEPQVQDFQIAAPALSAAIIFDPEELVARLKTIVLPFQIVGNGTSQRFTYSGLALAAGSANGGLASTDTLIDVTAPAGYLQSGSKLTAYAPGIGDERLWGGIERILSSMRFK